MKVKKIKKITDKEFNKLLKSKKPQQIIGLYTHWIINLSTKQLNQLIRMK